MGGCQVKKKYEKPSLTEVKLKPEEALLTGCKTPGGPGTFDICNAGVPPCVDGTAS